jgi:hypothetical protein
MTRLTCRRNHPTTGLQPPGPTMRRVLQTQDSPLKEHTMHAVLITFTSAASLDQVAEPFERYAHALRAVPGLVMKTWIADGSTLGGFHIFDDPSHADNYLTGELLATVTANPIFTDFHVTRFDIIDTLSAINGSPATQTAT